VYHPFWEFLFATPMISSCTSVECVKDKIYSWKELLHGLYFNNIPELNDLKTYSIKKKFKILHSKNIF